ncbi:hypothetical protein ACHAXR_001248 [Thalassiosira sp. AJA248-18]
MVVHKNCVSSAAACIIGICLMAPPFSYSFLMDVAPINNPRCIPPPAWPSLQGSANNNDPIGSYMKNSPAAASTNNTNTQNNEPMDEDEDGTLKASRFSKYAPDANTLDATDFRSQLRENMKADLERRRAEDPNRGNQPAKHYLEGL